MKIPRHLIDIDPALAIIVIGLVIAAVVPALKSDCRPVPAVRHTIQGGLAAALELFRRDNGDYPSTAQGLDALVEQPIYGIGSGRTWRGPYLKSARILKDSWGNPYVYIYPGIKNTDSYDLASLGPDGRASKDDIKNWVRK